MRFESALACTWIALLSSLKIFVLISVFQKIQQDRLYLCDHKTCYDIDQENRVQRFASIEREAKVLQGNDFS